MLRLRCFFRLLLDCETGREKTNKSKAFCKIESEAVDEDGRLVNLGRRCDMADRLF